MSFLRRFQLHIGSGDRRELRLADTHEIQLRSYSE